MWVFDATNLGATLGGTPETVVTLFGDTPRALTVSPDGNTVYAAIFHSGNRTTTISEGAVCDGGSGSSTEWINGLSNPIGESYHPKTTGQANGYYPVVHATTG